MGSQKNLKKTGLKASIIIPVYNDKARLIKVLDAINNQIDKTISVEVFVVDNASTENIGDVVSSYSFAKYILEDQYLNSPYSCRNRGIEKATGDIVVLLDATCIPHKDWLRTGLNFFSDTTNKIVGGEVEFELSNHSTAFEFVDAMTSVQMGNSIKYNNRAFTANLWVPMKMFDQFGQFPEGLRSGGDVRWTRKLTQNGIPLVFNEACIVYKSTRKRKALKQKKWRTSIQQTQKWIDINANHKILRHIRAFFKLAVLPPKPGRLNLKSRIPMEIYSSNKFIELRVWLADYELRILEAFGIIYGAFQVISRRIFRSN